MAGRKLLITGVAITVAMAGFAQTAQGHGGGGGGGGGMRGGGRGFGAGAFYGGWGWGWGFGFPFFYPPVFVMGPGMFFPPMPMAMPSGPLMPPPPRGMFQPPADVNAQRNCPNNADPARAAQLLVVGDRLLKSGNLRKAEERYTQAMRLAPDLAAPRVRLAQVAIARANYTEAASRLREAETAEPGWIITAPTSRASMASQPNSPARSHGWNHTSRPIPKTATPGWSWAQSGSSPAEPPGPPTSSSDSMTPPANPISR